MELSQYMLLQQPIVTQLFIFAGQQVPTISTLGASQNRFAPISLHKMNVDKELSSQLMMAKVSKLIREWAYKGHISNAPKSKSKEKEKAREPSQSVESNEQLACLLQHLQNAGVLEDIGIDVLQDPVVQIAFNQVLNEQ